MFQSVTSAFLRSAVEWLFGIKLHPRMSALFYCFEILNLRGKRIKEYWEIMEAGDILQS